MGIGNGPKRPSYNLQTAVDADTGLILHRHEVTTEPTDNPLLYPMAAAAKDAPQSMRSPQMLATQMGRTQPPARVTGLGRASPQTVRLTIKATGHSSTHPPSSISRTVTPNHVRPAASYAKIMRRHNCVVYRRSGTARMCFDVL
jgi:hypothetical protein